MSRAFPFPSPGYVRHLAYGRDLVESTKLQRALEVTKKDPSKEKKKQEKKEKKGKRKERKEKEKKSHKTSNVYTRKEDDKLRQFDEKKVCDDETEQLEKSGLTDEHDLPQNLCYLSDGTQSSKKRKRQGPCSFEKQNQGKRPLRIRFVLGKPKESQVLSDQEQLCSTSGAESVTDHNGKAIIPEARDARTNIIAGTSYSESDEKSNLDSKKGSSAISIDPSKNQMTREESAYQSLFENWVPQELNFRPNDDDDDDDDDEWLFGLKKQDNSDVKRIRREEISKACGGSSWPQAQFLPEVGIYTLPYTIPF